MDKPQHLASKDFAPDLLNGFKKLFNNAVLTAIREGLTFALPVIVAGTIVVLANSFPLPIYQEYMAKIFGPSWHSFGGYVWNGTLGFLSVVMAVSISNSFSEQYNNLNPSRRITPSIVSLVTLASLICTMEPGRLFLGQDLGAGGGALPSLWLGVHGLLWATFIAILAGHIFRWLLKFDSLRVSLNYSASVDTTVSQVLDTLVPGILTIFVFASIKAISKYFGIDDINASIYRLLYLPFQNMGGSMLETAAIYGVIRHLLWFFGIHGSNVLEPIMTELYLPGIAANQALLESGKEAFHIFTKPFFDCYTSLGGSGSTGGLLIACLLKHRDSGSKKIARISIAPAIFNINEILLFGLPVVLNPVFLVPFILVPLVLTAVAYLANASGMVPLTIHEVAWNVPIFVSGYLATESIAGPILQLFCLLISTLIYLPFVSLDNWLKTEQFDRTYKKLVQVTSTHTTSEPTGPKYISGTDTVGSMARFLANDMERGFEMKEFFLVYQPQVDSRSGRVYGVEALLRWRHPQIGLVPPPVFIGLAEDSGFINKLGLLAAEDACILAAKWHKIPDAEHISVSINVSARQLDDMSLPDKIFQLTQKHGVPVENIKIEVTESVAIGGQDRHQILNLFSKLGFKLAIDDFGMGYTSLSYIKQFKVSSLKLDSIISRDVLVSRSSREIVFTMADLCRNLGIELIAEFVEDEAHLLKLRELGCYNIQGYYYSPPLSPEECLQYILSQQASYGEIEIRNKEEMELDLDMDEDF